MAANVRSVLFHQGETVRLTVTDETPEQYATIVTGNYIDDDVYDDDAYALVLLYPEYRNHEKYKVFREIDDGLRDVPIDQIRKQYEDVPFVFHDCGPRGMADENASIPGCEHLAMREKKEC